MPKGRKTANSPFVPTPEYLKGVGFETDGEGVWAHPDANEVMTFEQACDLYAEQTKARMSEPEKPKREVIRVPHCVAETAEMVCQYLSTDMKIMARWGEEEFSLKSAVDGIVRSWQGSITPGLNVDAKMAKNAINGLKRSGVIESAGKGKLKVGTIAKTDWSIFRREP